MVSGRRVFFFQAEDGIRDLVRSRGLGDVYKRQVPTRVIRTGIDSRDVPQRCVRRGHRVGAAHEARAAQRANPGVRFGAVRGRALVGRAHVGRASARQARRIASG